MSLTAVQADIFLHHLEIQSSNPERLSNFYSNIMDMKIDKLSSDKFLCDGPSRKIIITLGKDKTLSHAGMVCRNENNLNGFKDFLNQKELKLKDYNSELYKPGSFSVEDPDKNVLCFGVLKDKSTASLNGIHAPLQHLTFASEDVVSFQNFYENKLGFQVTDRVVKNNGELATCFTTSNHEHHTIACFKSSKKGMDHHSYEAGDWNHIKGWCDHFASNNIKLMWGPGRHGPGNNLFVFIEDIDGNWIEISAELETVHGRPVKNWPQEERTLNLWGNAIMRS
jgi:catechol-2,3-dioxygenase|tara:strand:- start:203 stop:1045 length:843 start_codon:yes stop_codon:yes gene_type:complete